MQVTIGELRKRLAGLPDDMPIWIEYPARYGLAAPIKMLKNFGPEDQDFIQAMTVGYDKDRFYIFHHY